MLTDVLNQIDTALAVMAADEYSLFHDDVAFATFMVAYLSVHRDYPRDLLGLEKGITKDLDTILRYYEDLARKDLEHELQIITNRAYGLLLIGSGLLSFLSYRDTFEDIEASLKRAKLVIQEDLKKA